MSASHIAHQPHFSKDHRGGGLSDATNTFDPQHRAMKFPVENANGDFSQQTYSNHQQQQQQQQQYYNPAPYPPLPPAVPLAPNPAYLPLPPAPPLSWPSSCYDFSTPPAPAPYPPLPRAEAIPPRSLDAVYSTSDAPAPEHAFPRGAVGLPLPAEAMSGLPQLVADYCSPMASEQPTRHRSVSPPPPPPPPARDQFTGDYSSPVPAAMQHGASTPQPPPPPPRPMTASKDGSGSSSSRRRRPENDNWVPPPPLQWWQGPSSTSEEAASAPLPDPRKTSTSSSTQSGRSPARDPRKARNTSTSSSTHSGKSSSGGNSRGDKSSSRESTRSSTDYVIPKKKDASKCRVKDQPYTIPKKDGRSASSVTQKNSVYSLDTLRMFGGVKSSPGGACSANRRRADSAHSQYSNASGGGRADDRARWLEKEDGHKRRDRNGRDGAKSSSSSSRHGGRPASGRGNSDKNDRYRRRNDRSVGPDLDSRGGPYGRSREYEDGDGRRGRRGERDERWDKGSGKSCPPPRSEKRRDASLVDLSGEAEDADLVDLSTEEDDTSLEGLSAEGDDELAELTSQLTALELEAGKEQGAVGEGKATAGAASVTAKAYLSLEEYKEATAKGEIKTYKGTKYQTVDARYADGWAYNANTRRWVKVACQEKKNAMEALPALLARLELMESKDKLAKQRSQLLETKVEKITKEKEAGRKTVSLAVPTAPILVAFDTNWLIHHLADTMCRVSDIAGRHADTSVLIPKEVLSELDRLKTRGKDQATRSSAQKANRYFRGLVEKPLERGREFPVVRVQEDTELFRDQGHHSRPEGLGGDDSILNCCMFFTQGIEKPRKVTLVTGDNNFAIRASAHGLMTMGRPQCDPGHCRMPLCPAPLRASPFSRGY